MSNSLVLSLQVAALSCSNLAMLRSKKVCSQKREQDYMLSQ